MCERVSKTCVANRPLDFLRKKTTTRFQHEAEIDGCFAWPPFVFGHLEIGSESAH